MTWAGEYFYKRKDHPTKKNLYECGFKSVTDINIQINFNFAMVCVFLVLYDIEFTFLIPAVFNSEFFFISSFAVLMCFIALIIVSLFYDWQVNSLN